MEQKTSGLTLHSFGRTPENKNSSEQWLIQTGQTFPS